MRKPRTHTFLLMAVLLLAVLAGQAWLGERSPVAEEFVRMGHAETAAAVGMPVAPPIAAVAADVGHAAPVEVLSADASGLLNAMCDLQLLAEGTGLYLDSDQWSGLATVVTRTQAIRHSYEASIARLQVVAAGVYRVEIPTYAETGAVLRERFQTEVCATLGATTGQDVLAKLGARLEGRFAGFGLHEQTLELTADLDALAEDIRIERTVAVGASLAVGERRVIRREINFPALDDPTGDSWAALLARVADAG